MRETIYSLFVIDNIMSVLVDEMQTLYNSLAFAASENSSHHFVHQNTFHISEYITLDQSVVLVESLLTVRDQ